VLSFLSSPLLSSFEGINKEQRTRTTTTTMSDTEENPSPKRRRINAADEDDEGDNADNGGLGETPPQGDSRSSRAALMERRSAQRRAQRRDAALHAEVADLEEDGGVTLQAEEFTAVDDGAASPPQSDVDDEVDQDHDYDDGLLQEEEGEGEDLLENAERDYQRIDALDHYGTEGMDERDYGGIDIEERHAAEAELSIRDRQSGGGGRSDGLYGAALDVMETEEDEDARRARRGIFRGEEEADAVEDEETDEEDLDGDDPINIEAFDVDLQEWIAQDRTRKEIQRKFRAFLRHFTEESIGEEQRRRRGNGIYEKKIRQMCASNLATLQVSYLHLMEAEPILAVWLTETPKDMLDVLNEAASRHTLMLFPSYNSIKTEIHVRISDVPILDSLRDLRRCHLGNLVKVHGVITRRGSVYPQLQLAHYRCLSCKATQGPFRIDTVGNDNAADSYKPDDCIHCESKFMRLDTALSKYQNFQRVNLQETPGSVPPGRVPRTKEVILTNDLIDIARPGEEIEVTGIYEHKFDFNLTLKSGFPVFSTSLTANHIRRREDASSASNLAESDVRKIIELSKDPRIGERIVQSIAPSIFGHDNCKMALAMSLFGGVAKNINDKHRIRGDVNVLLLGDPGTAKSQLLKYAEYTAPRAVYSTGKGASAVGLTAGVHKDPITKEWTLEGGALVLADKGVCLIDEFDKSELARATFFIFLFFFKSNASMISFYPVNEQDRTSIHEGMSLPVY
jgi:DNA replication licensing factor MCM2